MERTLRCRQCGWVVDLTLGCLPRYGARCRCGQCDTLLPLVEPSAEEPPLSAKRHPREGRPPRSRSGAGAAAPEASVPPLRLAARARVATWLEEQARGERAPLSETILWGERGSELADLVSAWQRDHPGPEALMALRAELLAATADRGGAPCGGAPAAGPASPSSPGEPSGPPTRA